MVSTRATQVRAARRALAQLEDLLDRSNTKLVADWHGEVWLVHRDETERPKNGHVSRDFAGFPVERP